MYITVGGRQFGKTTELIKHVLSNPKAVLVVHSFHRKRQLERDYINLVSRVFTFAEVTACPYLVRHRDCYIDDADLILRQLIPAKRICEVTMTGGLKVLPWPPHLTKERLADLKATVGDDLFRTEYMGEWTPHSFDKD